MTQPVEAPKRPKSKLVAKVSSDLCTGCEACLSVMPNDDCLVKLDLGPSTPFGMAVVDVQDDKCTGCTLCMRICPWEAITMISRPEKAHPLTAPFIAYGMPETK